tara:strand:+ start:8094 stop:8486 length:393 start_codon:yes stop_codon:yes gene_type:complete
LLEFGFIPTSTENTIVKKTRVLLGTPEGLQSQLLVEALRDQQDVELVGHVSDPVATLISIARTKPDVWIHGWEEGPELQAMLSHVYSCDSSISVVRIDPNDAAGYVQVPVNSMASLLSFIRQGRQLEPAC